MPRAGRGRGPPRGSRAGGLAGGLAGGPRRGRTRGFKDRVEFFFRVFAASMTASTASTPGRGRRGVEPRGVHEHAALAALPGDGRPHPRDPPRAAPPLTHSRAARPRGVGGAFAGVCRSTAHSRTLHCTLRGPLAAGCRGLGQGTDRHRSLWRVVCCVLCVSRSCVHGAVPARNRNQAEPQGGALRPPPLPPSLPSGRATRQTPISTHPSIPTKQRASQRGKTPRLTSF